MITTWCTGEKLVKLVHKLLSAVAEVHKKNVAHGDLKLDFLFVLSLLYVSYM